MTTERKHDELKGMIYKYGEHILDNDDDDELVWDWDEVDATDILEFAEFWKSHGCDAYEEEIIKEIESISNEYGSLITVGEYDENYELFASREFDKCRRA